jgi:S-adenosyl-L-methionine hydrolase (adenosine-forming)
MSIVTLTTDFGTVDGYVGAMKGVVLSLARDATMVDITHDIPRHDIAAGAFAVAQAAPLFPPGTVHVAVVDPGVGGSRADIVVEAGGSYYVGPDNGLLALAARGPRVAHLIERAEFRRHPVSPTFHGRDVFAQTAGLLARGAHPREAGPVLPAIEELGAPLPEPDRPAGEGLAAVIVHIDAFGNLITSLPGDFLVPGTWLVLVPSHRRRPVSLRAGHTYAEVQPGEPVAYVGSTGLVEIAVREGSAAQTIGLARGDHLRLERRER